MLWLVIILVTLAVIVTIIYAVRHGNIIAVKKKVPMGEQLRKGAEAIPVYGTFVKAAGIVGKPVNNVLDKWTSMQISAVKHVPVAGKYLAMPAEITQNAVKKLNNWLGL